MRITNCQYESYHLPLKTPWVTATETISHRDGFIIHIESDNGLTGLGDCSPITGTETLEQAEQFLQSQRTDCIYQAVDKLLEQELPTHSHPASCFAVESALLCLQAQSRHLKTAQLLNKNAAESIAVNAMIGKLDKQVFENAKQAEQQGYGIIKVKLGVQPPETEWPLLQALMTQLDGGTLLRLDCNQSLDLSQAQQLLAKLAPFSAHIDAIEEPLQAQQFDSLATLQASTDIALALDESLPAFLQQHSLDQLPVKRIIIKPMILGSIRQAYQVAQQAQQKNIEVVVTSSLETAVGVNHCIQLAAAINNQQCHGLATQDWLLENIGKLKTIDSGRVVL